MLEQLKFFQNCQKGSTNCPSFADIITFFYNSYQFSGNLRFFKTFALIFSEKLVLGIYNYKSNVIQVIESNYIDSNCLYSQKD